MMARVQALQGMGSAAAAERWAVPEGLALPAPEAPFWRALLIGLGIELAAVLVLGWLVPRVQQTQAPPAPPTQVHLVQPEPPTPPQPVTPPEPQPKPTPQPPQVHAQPLPTPKTPPIQPMTAAAVPDVTPPPQQVAPPAPPPAPPPPPQPSRSARISALDRYAALLRARVQSNVSVPPVVRMMGIRGTAVVGFRLRPDGTLLRAWLVHGSGTEAIDDAALQTVRRTDYPPFTSKMPQHAVDFQVRVRLDGNAGDN